MAEEKKKEDLNYQFVSLVFSLQQAAMVQLGKIANPVTGKMEKNLVQAKATIDMLEMLKEKSKGNLTETEQKIVLNTLDNLYLNYAAEVEKPAVAEAPKETAEAQKEKPAVAEAPKETAEAQKEKPAVAEAQKETAKPAESAEKKEEKPAVAEAQKETAEAQKEKPAEGAKETAEKPKEEKKEEKKE